MRHRVRLAARLREQERPRRNASRLPPLAVLTASDRPTGGVKGDGAFGPGRAIGRGGRYRVPPGHGAGIDSGEQLTLSSVDAVS